LNPLWTTRLTFSEFEAWGYIAEVPTSPPSSTIALLAPGYPVSASSYVSLSRLSNVLDGNTYSTFESDLSTDAHWLIVDVKSGRGSEVTIETLSIWNSLAQNAQDTCCQRRFHGTTISLLDSNDSVLASAVVGVVHGQDEYKFDFGSVSNVASIRHNIDATDFWNKPTKRLQVAEMQAWGTVP